MKILIIVTRGIVGGTTTFLASLAKGLKENGLEVLVGTGKEGYLKELLEKENIELIKFKWLKRTYNPLINLLFALEIKNFLNKTPVDVLHLNSSNSLWAVLGAKFLKKKPKIIFTVHGLSILDPNYKSFFKPIFFLFFKFLLSLVDTLVFVSQRNLEEAKKMKLVKNGVVIYNGIPEPKFLERERAREFLEKKIKVSLDNKFLIGSIGRLDYPKNYEFLIEVFPEVLKIKENALFILVGEGPQRKKLEKIIERLKLNGKIFLVGEIKNACQYLKAFDLFVLPSRYEGLSMTLIETLFAKIPVLASNVGGNEEIVGKECIFELNNKNEFLEKLKNPKIPKTNSEIFKIEKTSGKYFKLYQQVLENPTSSPIPF